MTADAQNTDADAPLLPAVARGDTGAVRRCVDRYGGFLMALARRHRADPSEIEDVVQEIFIALWKHAGRFDPSVASERTFVAMIARRRLIDAHRKGTRTPSGPAAETLPLEAPTTDPARRAEAKRVLASMEALKEDERLVLQLSLWEGHTHAEIAERLARPLGTVKSHARRGLQRLQALLAEGSA